MTSGWTQLFLLLSSTTITQGEVFLFAFAGHGVPTIWEYAFEVGGTVNISLPSDESPFKQFNVPSRGFNYTGSMNWLLSEGIEDKSVIVNTPRGSDIEVIGYFEPFGVGCIHPLPISALGTRYIVSSCDLPDSSHEFVLVVATHDFSSQVDITFRLNASVSYENRTYSNGEKLTLSLDAYKTFTLISDFDLSGTVVSSCQTVAVFAGTRYKSSGWILSYEQMLPVKCLGQEYIVAALPYGENLLKIVSGQSDTQITFNNVSTVTVDEHYIYRLSLGQSEVIHLIASKPVIVSMCSTIYIPLVSMALTVVPPIKLYTTGETAVYGLSDPVLILSATTDGDFQVYTSEVGIGSNITWTSIENTEYRVGKVEICYGVCLVTSESQYAVIGSWSHRSSYSMGFNFSKAGSVSSDQTALPGIDCNISLMADPTTLTTTSTVVMAPEISTLSRLLISPVA